MIAAQLFNDLGKAHAKQSTIKRAFLSPVLIASAIALVLAASASTVRSQIVLSVQDQNLTPSDGAAGDGFGASVSISANSNTLLVGAFLADIGGNIDQGAAYLFERAPGGQFNPSAFVKLVATDGFADGGFGFSVSLSSDGNTAAVTALPKFEDSAVYIFDRNEGGPGNWGQIKKITHPEVPTPFFPTNVLFGDSLHLAADGATIVIGDSGATFPPTPGAVSRGAAYVYERNLGSPNNWGLRKRLEDAAGNHNDFFGVSVSLASDTAMIGARSAGGAGGEGPGKVYLFERDAGGADSWGLSKMITASDGANGDGFGLGVALTSDGNTVAAGAPGPLPGPGNPRIYLFDRDNGGAENWGETKIIPVGSGRPIQLRFSVSDDDVLIAGINAGARIFGRNVAGAGNWGFIKDLVAQGGEADADGAGIAMAGNTSVIGASETDFGGSIDQGVAFIFGPARFRPDHLIGKKRGRQKGDDQYSASGAGQKQRVVGKGRRKVKYFTTVQNDGNTTDSITVRGRLKNRKFRTTYKQIFPVPRNVTALVKRSGLLLVLDPATSALFKVINKPRTMRTRRTFRITAQSNNDPSAADLVIAKAQDEAEVTTG